MAKFNRPNQYTGKQSNQNWTGSVRAANANEAAAGDSTQTYISPATLASAVGDLVPSATTAIEGVVLITDNSSPVATKVYVDAIAIAGAPAWSETVSGIGQLATTAEAQAGTNDNVAMTPAKVVDLLETPPAIGGTTPAAGSFTTIAASGLASLSGSATILSGGTAINIGSDASADAINVGTGAAARTITIGNVTGATAVAINTGTGHFTVTTTSTGDIILNSADTMLLDSAGVLELNSSAGVISIGNDDIDQNINISTDGERVLTLGSNNGAAQVDIESGTGGVNISTAASAQSVTIGNNTGATALVLEVGTGDFTLDGVGASTYTIGADTTSGTISIGGTAQTGNMTIGSSSGTNALRIANGSGATTVSIAAVQTAGAVNIGTAMTSGTITIGGTGLQTGTVSIAPGTGAQAVNIATGGTGIKTVSIATGAVANIVNIGSSSAGAIAVDTAAGISLDGATASNFTVSGATEDLNLASDAGRVIVTAGEDAADAIYLHANAGTSETIRLHSDLGTGADSVHLESDVGGITLTSGLASSDAINLVSTNGGLDIDAALDIVITSTEDAANSIYLHANGGTSETIRLHSDLGTGVGSVTLESDVGGITALSGLASADAINLTASAGGVDIDGALQVNIASSQADPGAITLVSSNASGGITHTGKCVYTPDSITSDNAGVAASVSTVLTQITTDGDSNEDNVTLADGVAGQLKIFAVVAAGNAADSIKITPANMAGGTKITFAADPTGLGCTMIFDGTNWCVVANNGGTIA